MLFISQIIKFFQEREKAKYKNKFYHYSILYQAYLLCICTFVCILSIFIFIKLDYTFCFDFFLIVYYIIFRKNVCI